MSDSKHDFHIDIFDHSTVAYYVIEMVLNEKGRPIDWIYRYCNQAFADLKGYRLDAMIDHSFLSLHPQVDQKWMAAYYRAACENTENELNLTIQMPYHAVVSPIGKKRFCSCMIYEERIRTQRDVEQDLLEKETYMLKKLLPEYVSLYRIDLNSEKYEVLRLEENTNARKLANQGLNCFATFDEYSRQYADDFISMEDREEFLDWHCCQNMKRRFHSTEKLTYHYKSTSRDGKESYYEAYAVKGQIDDENYIIFLGYRNIDGILYKEKAIQRQLKNALEEARLSNEIIASIAKAFQYVSRIDIEEDTFEEIINKEREELKFIKSGTLSVNNKKVCTQCVAQEYQEAFLRFTDISTLADRMDKEESIAMEYRMKDGNWHRLCFIEKKRDETGRLTHVLCAIRSVSATKKREQNLINQVAEAKKEAISKNRFLSNMSHDIRTPINGIIGMLELSNRYPDDLKIQKRCRDGVLESSRYLVSLVNDILDMNKLEAEEETDLNISFDLAELLSQTNADKQGQAVEKQIDYVVDWSRAGLKHQYLIGNPLYVGRLLTAVVDNAIKFTNPGGSVRVWCEEKSADAEKVVYQFGCSDNGIGMSEEFMEHAFEMFSQENETSRSRYEGSGLGLAIAKKIADRLDGTIEIQSQKGKGTTVLMTIPFEIGEKTETKKTIDLENVSVEGLRILVVEDNDLNMEIVKFLLEENGIHVECAVDGLEAVEKFAGSEPGYYDVICMDIMMPNLNGWDAARRIRAMKRTDAKKVPMIAMSANAFAEDRINSRISGMNQHISKPLDMEKLLNAVKDCVGNRTCK